jgi:hypothetical protein
MDQLPQELVDRVCGYLPSEDLRNTYYVSTKFRKAAEEHAEKHRSWQHTLKIDKETTVEQKQQLINRYSGFRLRYLKEVQFSPHFPDLEIAAPGYRESAEEQYEKDMIFTGQVLDLFTALKAMEDRAGERNRGRYQLTINPPTRNLSGFDDCYHLRSVHWRTHLLQPEALPGLHSVFVLQIEDHETSSAKFDYRILIDLAIKCPNLNRLECHIGSQEWDSPYSEEPAKLFLCEYDGPRRDTRHGFGKAVTPNNIPRSLQHVELNFFCRLLGDNWDAIDHGKPMPDLVSPFSKDPFSGSLRILSYQLKELTLRVQADETLFWPEDTSTPTWPSLQRVSIMIHIVSPSGAWYFEGPRGEGRNTIGYEVNESSYPPLEHTDEDEGDDFDVEDGGRRSFEDIYHFQFRISPHEAVLRPFLASFAKAAANMPELRMAILWSPLRFDIDGRSADGSEPSDYDDLPDNLYQHRECLAWGLAYYKPNYRSYFTKNPAAYFSSARRILWKVGEWRPDPELHDLFQQIGRREHGEVLEEQWEDEEYGRGLIPRGDFETWTPPSSNGY